MGKYVSYEDYARLKAEVERYSNFVETAHVDLNAQNARLKAEVERLTPLLSDIVSFDEYFKLLQQVERLTKAGDELGEWFMDIHPSKKKWLAAKEGKQP